MFSSDALPTSYLASSLFTSSSFEVAFMDDQPTPHFYFLSGKLDIPAAVTPIPAALPLFLTALGGLGLIARRRRTNACRAEATVAA